MACDWQGSGKSGCETQLTAVTCCGVYEQHSYACALAFADTASADVTTCTVIRKGSRSQTVERSEGTECYPATGGVIQSSPCVKVQKIHPRWLYKRQKEDKDVEI